MALVLVGFVVLAAGIIWRRAYGDRHERERAMLARQLEGLKDERQSLEAAIRLESGHLHLQPIVEQNLGMHIAAGSELVHLSRKPPHD
jgi:hypothetical protein